MHYQFSGTLRGCYTRASKNFKIKCLGFWRRSLLDMQLSRNLNHSLQIFIGQVAQVKALALQWLQLQGFPYFPKPTLSPIPLLRLTKNLFHLQSLKPRLKLGSPQCIIDPTPLDHLLIGFQNLLDQE